MNKIHPIFNGKVEHGKMILYDQSAFDIWIAGLEGKPITARIEISRNDRTNNQNAYLWGVVYKVISDTFGWTDDDVHEFCKNKFNPKFLEITDKATGEKEELKIGGSTRKLSTLDFMEYVEKIQIFFAEHDCFIPDPNLTEIANPLI